MNIKKIYANESGQGTLVCAKCGKTKTIDLVEFKNIGKPPAIPGKPPRPVITVSSVLAFRKHRCENPPVT